MVDDVVAPELTDEIEGMLDGSLREYAGLEPTPILSSDDGTPSSPVDRIPTGVMAHVGATFVEIPLVIEDGHFPLIDAVYGVYGYGTPALPDAAAPPTDLADDTPALVAWGNPPPDAK